MAASLERELREANFSFLVFFSFVFGKSHECLLSTARRRDQQGNRSIVFSFSRVPFFCVGDTVKISGSALISAASLMNLIIGEWREHIPQVVKVNSSLFSFLCIVSSTYMHFFHFLIISPCPFCSSCPSFRFLMRV